MLRRLPFLFILFFISVMLGACDKPLLQWPAILERLKNRPPEPDKLEGRVIARVEGLAITEVECNHELQKYYDNPDFLLSEQNRNVVIKNLIRRKAIIQLARQRGLDRSARVFLKIRDYEESILIDEYRKLLASKANLKDLFKEASTGAFADFSGEIASSHIELMDLAQARKAQALLKSAKSFESVARLMSIDKATASKGGRQGFLKNGQRDPAVVMALQGLKDKQISDIVRTARGYEIIRRDETRTRPLTPIEREVLHNAILYNHVDSQIEMDESRMKIEVDSVALNDVFQRAWQIARQRAPSGKSHK